MIVPKSGDLVVLRSGGPVMTVDTVNTDIFDDEKVTGIFCAWFVGNRLERARFDPAALEFASARGVASEERDVASVERATPGADNEPSAGAGGEYKIVLDEMVAAMNDPAENPKQAPRASVKKPRNAAGQPVSTFP